MTRGDGSIATRCYPDDKDGKDDAPVCADVPGVGSGEDRLARGNVLAVVRAVGGAEAGPAGYTSTQTSASYQEDNLPSSVTDGRGRRIDLPVSTVRGTSALRFAPDGGARTAAQRGSGHELAGRDGALDPFGSRGASWTSQFDGFGRVARTTGGGTGGSLTEVEFAADAKGRLKAGLAKQIRQGQTAHSLEIERDERGNPILRRWSQGRVARTGYDAWDRPVESSDGERDGGSLAPVGAGGPECGATGSVAQQAFDAAGHVVVERRLSDVVDATGTPSCRWVETRFTYNAREQRLSVAVDQLASGLVPGAIDPSSREVTRYDYDEHGRLASETAVGEVAPSVATRLGYDPAGRVSSVQVGSAGVVATGYDAVGRVARQTDGDVGVWRGRYDAWDRLFEERSPTGAVTRRRFDQADQLTRETVFDREPTSPGATVVADRVLATTSFGVARRSVEVLREVSTPEGTRYEVRITERDLDEEGRELAVWRGGAMVADPTVAVLDRNGARRERSAVYEPESGRLLAEEIGGTAGEGPQLRKRYTYASEAHTPWPTAVAVEEAVPGQSNLVPTVESTLVRDALGRVIEEKRSDGTLTRTTYDRTGGVLRQETGAGAVTLVVRDGRGLPIEEVRPAGRGSTRRAFDSSGALILESTSNASGTPWETRTTLDASGRPVRVDYADGSFETLAYHADSTVSHRRTRDGVEIDFTYDAANRLTSAVPTLPEGSPSATRIDAGDHTVYDALSRPTQIERGRSGIPGYDTELTLAIGGYDLASRPLAETVGTRSPLTWTYDAFDRRTRTTMGTLGTLERSYDTLDRLLTITGPNASGATWSWGGDRLYAMTAHGALGTTTRFGYAGGAGPQIPGQPGEDTTWRLATLTWGASGSSAPTTLPATTWGQFGYGWRGTATAPSDGARLGRAAIPAAPNAPNLTAGLGWSWSYDAATRLTGAASGIGDLTGASLDNGTATFDKHRFTYGEGDELERLVRESTGAITVVESGPYGRITSRNGQAFTYDGAGRRLEDDRFVLRWDWRGQLVSATVKPTWPDSDGDGQAEVTPYAGHQVRYAYDAAGRLAHRLHLGALPENSNDENARPFIDQRRYVWEGPSLLSESSYGLEGTEASLRWRKTYVPGPTGLDDAAQVVVEQGNQSRIYTYLRDELGTVQSLVAENESTDPLHPTIAGRYAYSPYGEAHVESAPELLRAHIDGDVTSANGTPQAISDPRLAAPGALLLDWSAALDASTLAAGVALDTQVGGTWTALAGADVAIALDSSATKLTILPIHGWTASTSYRVRLTPSLHDTLGRALAANETLELRTAAAPATGVMPAVPFDRKTTLSYESWRAANDTLGNRFPGGQSHLFQGAWTDPVTGMAYHRARWYEPRTAHWLSEDPAGTVDSVNLQAFVGWGPQGAVDPKGEAVPLPLAPPPPAVLPAPGAPGVGWQLVRGQGVLVKVGSTAARSGAAVLGPAIDVGVAAFWLTRQVNQWSGGAIDRRAQETMSNNILLLTGNGDAVAPGGASPNVLISEGWTAVRHTGGDVLLWLPPERSQVPPAPTVLAPDQVLKLGQGPLSPEAVSREQAPSQVDGHRLPYQDRRPNTRRPTVLSAWDSALPGTQRDRRACSTCGADVQGNPWLGETRNTPEGWDIDHIIHWLKTKLELDTRRADPSEYRDAYNDPQNTRLRCRSCNRSDNQPEIKH